MKHETNQDYYIYLMYLKNYADQDNKADLNRKVAISRYKTAILIDNQKYYMIKDYDMYCKVCSCTNNQNNDYEVVRLHQLIKELEQYKDKIYYSLDVIINDFKEWEHSFFCILNVFQCTINV